MRSLTKKQRAHIADVLRRLREHYPREWPGCAEGHEHRLMEFAYYEGCGYRWDCCREILAEAAPFTVGQELVANHGFRWIMLRAGRTWRYGVTHPALEHPIDLASLEDRSWNEEEYGEPTDPGRATIDSLPTIIERVRRIQEGEPVV